MKYRIVKTCKEIELEEIINELINEGWIPQGGISVHFYEGHLFFRQAMIKN